jgi:hypothetical protein
MSAFADELKRLAAEIRAFWRGELRLEATAALDLRPPPERESWRRMLDECLCMDCGIDQDQVDAVGGRIRWMTEHQCYACWLIDIRERQEREDARVARIVRAELERRFPR